MSRLARVALFVAVAVYCCCLIVEHDTPWYVASGDLLLRVHHLVARDPFSYTSTRPWLNHEWLTEILFSLVYRVGGWGGLSMLAASCAAGAIAIVSRTLEGAASIAYALAAIALRDLIEPRASAISLLLLAATYALAAADKDDGKRFGALWWCAPIQLVWTQAHGGDPFGIAILGLRWLTGPTQRRFSVAAACALLMIASPYGWTLFEQADTAPSTMAAIREWQPIFGALKEAALAPWAFVALLVAGLALVRPRDADGRFALALLVVFGAAACRWTRFVLEASLLCAAIVAPRLAARTRGLRFGAPLAIALSLAAFAGTTRTVGLGLDPARFPIDAARWLRANHPPGPMFNSYGFGGYLLWAWPEERVFSDGRSVTVYSTELLAEQPRLYADPSRWDALAARWGFRLAVLARTGRGVGVNERLAHDAQWRLAYRDDVADVYVHVAP